MKLEDIADVYIGVVLKRKEAVYKGHKTNEYKVFNIRCYEEKIEYDELIRNINTIIGSKNLRLFIYKSKGTLLMNIINTKNKSNIIKYNIFLESKLKNVKIKIHIILHNGLILCISDEAL